MYNLYASRSILIPLWLDFDSLVHKESDALAIYRKLAKNIIQPLLQFY